jgi:sodium-dependent phosphate transporter
MPVLHEYTYIFAIGTFFALLEAYNNGANDVANAWATSVSSRSVTYRQAMVCCIEEYHVSGDDANSWRSGLVFDI